jgi:hypothetical protein
MMAEVTRLLLSLTDGKELTACYQRTFICTGFDYLCIATIITGLSCLVEPLPRLVLQTAILAPATRMMNEVGGQAARCDGLV